MPQQTFGTATFQLVEGDITDQSVDVIVNAANGTLLGGSGVDGAIHKKGGPAILAACKEVRAELGGKLEEGKVAMTVAGDLDAQWVAHAVGPVWQGGYHGEFVALERCYWNSLVQAREKGATTIAFPSISTGAYAFPIDRAAYVACSTVTRFLKEEKHEFTDVRLVVLGDDSFKAHTAVFEEFMFTQIGTD